MTMSWKTGTGEASHPFAVSGERAVSLPKKAQRLLGYRSYLPSGEGSYDRLWVKDYEDILAGVAQCGVGGQVADQSSDN
jgi:hypothetical protein